MAHGFCPRNASGIQGAEGSFALRMKGRISRLVTHRVPAGTPGPQSFMFRLNPTSLVNAVVSDVVVFQFQSAPTVKCALKPPNAVSAPTSVLFWIPSELVTPCVVTSFLSSVMYTAEF